MKTEVERKNIMDTWVDDIFPAMNSPTSCWSKLHITACCEPGERNMESGPWKHRTNSFISSPRLSPSLSSTFSVLLGFISVDNDKLFLSKPNIFLSPLCSFLHSATATTVNAEVIRFKWSQQIMQRGHEVNCQRSLAAAAVMASCLPETW